MTQPPSAAVDQTRTGALPASVMIDFIARALVRVGLPADDARIVGELMVESDLTGADAHGIFRLPQYVQQIEDGAINPTPAITVNRTATGTALVDGDSGMGHLVVRRAAEAAIELARANGVGWVGTRHSNHAGSAGVYAAMPVAHGMVGIYSAVASANHMAVWGGTEPTLGTNPIAIGLPVGEGRARPRQLLLDMATTVVSYGTIKTYALQGKSLPAGWMVDRRTGGPLTDPRESAEGLLLPIGGYKGSGLALMLGFLAGTLNGAAMGLDVVDFNADTRTPNNTGQFVVALDVSRFVPLDQFEREVRRHAAALKSGARLPGVDAIRLPGEQRAERRTRRFKDGVILPPPVRAKLDALADRLAIARL